MFSSVGPYEVSKYNNLGASFDRIFLVQEGRYALRFSNKYEISSTLFYDDGTELGSLVCSTESIKDGNNYGLLNLISLRLEYVTVPRSSYWYLGGLKIWE